MEAQEASGLQPGLEPQAAPQGHHRWTGGHRQAAAPPPTEPAWNQTFTAAVINHVCPGANLTDDVGF